MDFRNWLGNSKMDFAVRATWTVILVVMSMGICTLLFGAYWLICKIFGI